jgi:hypothetical protein
MCGWGCRGFLVHREVGHKRASETRKFSETTSGSRHAETTPQVSQQVRKQKKEFFVTKAQAFLGS